MERILPCPFCGHLPHLEHERIEPCRNLENGDFYTRWKVKCHNCGTEKGGGLTEYRFCNDEKLLIINPNFDGRKKVIKEWNTRSTQNVFKE